METQPTTPDETPTKRGGSGTPATPQIERGACAVLFAYDVGLAIDLDEAQRRITTDKQRGSLRHKRRTPYYFEYQPAPLRVSQTIEAVHVGGYVTDATIDAVVYDFGAVSVQYRIPLRGAMANLRRLSDELWDHPQLLEQSEAVVRALLESIAPAVTKPLVPDLVEDYSIYEIEALSDGLDIDTVIAKHGLQLAQILRAESAVLSAQEIEDALGCQISFAPDDRALIDWNAALLFGTDLDDVRAVLEFANVELLELRYLDDRLDEALDQAYELSAKRGGVLGSFLGSKGTDLWQIAEFQMDSTLLYEGVSNALKLLGDQYLARVHRLVSQRFHLVDWDTSIRRKLQTIESVYGKISDRNDNRRLEVLEWIIIILIAVSIVMPFIPGVPGY